MKLITYLICIVVLLVATYIGVGTAVWDGASNHSFREAQFIAFAVMLVEGIIIAVVTPSNWIA